jgi:hypothetical protein
MCGKMAHQSLTVWAQAQDFHSVPFDHKILGGGPPPDGTGNTRIGEFRRVATRFADKKLPSVSVTRSTAADKGIQGIDAVDQAILE